ncbi:MAG: DUF3784 domain-containing protein [Flavobacteriaceae bacterium]|jgi:hypothetical protein
MIALHITVIATGLLYVAISKYINKENAKYLLSGYNTMSKPEQEKFDIVGYLAFFKPFFYNLGIYSTFLYFILFYTIDYQFAIWAWIAAQILPLPYMIVKGKRFKNKN